MHHIVDPSSQGGGFFNWAPFNFGRPRALLVAIQSATYRPLMQLYYDRSVTDAVARIPDLMEAELRDAIEYRASRGGGMPRLGAS